MDRSNSGTTLTGAATTTTNGNGKANANRTPGKSSSSSQRSNRSTTTTRTTTLLVVLLGLLAVGQIVFVTPPDPALIRRSSAQQQQQQTSSSSNNNNNNLIDPTAWKVSHHLAAKEEREVAVAAAATASVYENEILGGGSREAPAGEYETVGMMHHDNESSSLPAVDETTKEAATVPSIATVPTTHIPVPAAVAVLASNSNNSFGGGGGGNDSDKTSDAPPPSSSLSIMLQKAGLSDISKADLAGLPTVEELTRQYGNVLSGRPVITGMDSCERYRQQVKQRRRYAAPAGMFNTGTNALVFHLEHNLQAAQKWQVPWGKHRMESVRLTHTAPSMEMAHKQDALPIVMIRDPLHWMQSMCKQPYAADWKHSKTHCPNLVPSEQERPEPTGAVPVDIKFDKTSKFHWESLVDLWNDWYRQYLEADYPRLLVRFEDLLFQAPAVMQHISDCMGVDFNAETFQYQTKSAKGHGSHTDFLHAIIKSGNETARKKGMTEADLTFAAQHLDVDLMRIFQYRTPVE